MNELFKKRKRLYTYKLFRNVSVNVSEYSSQIPVQHLRLVPAVCGSVVVPLVYQIAVELGFTRWAALLAGAFILLGM